MITSLFKFAAKSAFAFVGIIFLMLFTVVLLITGLVQVIQALI